MNPTSPNSKKEKRSARKAAKPIKVTAITEEERILAFLEEEGFRPMTAEEKSELARAGCLGMPEE
ncbi:MAG: hypothetical protein AB3N63_13425 [Puniceicoccaceae bacterium]